MDNTDAIIKELHEEAAQLLASKGNDEFIIDSLMRRGIDRKYAKTILENVRSDKSDKKQFYKHFFGGIFIFLAGALLSWETFSRAQPGGLFFVFTGIMLYGIFAVTQAIIIFRK
jgi:hypothetical protein